jgi:hypothetical protein
MAFRELLTNIKRKFHLSPNYFGEMVEYRPAGGEVARCINVHITDEENLDLEQDETEVRSRTIRVKCLKCPLEGIDRPNIGDTIIRSQSHDVDQFPYVYMGEHDQDCEDSWRLHFERRRRDTQGFL